MMIVGAATPPGRLAAAISTAAELVQDQHSGITVEVLRNLCKRHQSMIVV
jgi:hypothetical protein